MRLIAMLVSVFAFGHGQAQEGDWDKYLVMVAGLWAAEGIYGDEVQHRFNAAFGGWHDGGAGHVGGFFAGPSIAERHLWEQLPDEENSQLFRQGRHGGPHFGEGALHQSTASASVPVVARGFKLEPAEESNSLPGGALGGQPATRSLRRRKVVQGTRADGRVGFDAVRDRSTEAPEFAMARRACERVQCIRQDLRCE